MRQVTFMAVLSLFFILGAEKNSNAMGKGDLPRFRVVTEDQIYRGGQPTEEGLEELAKMNVKTIINLRDEDPAMADKEEKIARRLGMRYVGVPLSGIFRPTHPKMRRIEDVLVDPNAWPVFVHCRQGKDRTGLVIGLYRINVQKWTPKEAYREMIQIGFSPSLLGLKNYFDDETGYRD